MTTCVWPHFLVMPNTVTGALQNPSFRGKSNIPGLFYLFYLFTRLNAHISEMAKCFGTPVGFSGTRSLSEPRVQLAGSGHTTSATRELRTTMSMSRSSRAAAGLFRRLAVTPGARLGAASPAAWSQVRARLRSFKRATRSDDDAVPTQNALPTPPPAGRALGHGGPPRRQLRRSRGRQPRIRRGSRPHHRGRGPQAPRQVTHPPRTTHRVTYPLDAATAFYKCRPIFTPPPRPH